MKQPQYDRLLESVFSLILESDLSCALSNPRPAQRVDAIQDLIRNAIYNSSIGRYKGVPYFFNGMIYEEMSHDEFGNLIYDLMKKCGLPLGDYSRVDSIIRVCKRIVGGKEYQPDRTIMVFRNCVLDTKTRTMHKFDPAFIQMSYVDYDYKPDDVALQWNIFINQVLPDSKDRDTLQEALGCMLINRREAKMEHITFLYGTGANGKSVVFETVVGLFGRDNISNYPLNSLIGTGDKKKNIASMDGKWANYSPESQQVDIARNEDGFKSLTSGEPTEARQIYGENFMAYNIPLQFANLNKLPEIGNMGNALKRRIVIIGFKVEIPAHKQNKQLSRIFESEYSGIFNWVMDGRDRFVKNGYEFSHRDVIEEKADEYQSDCSTVMKFMRRMRYERINKSMVDAIPKLISSTTLYNKYYKWCMANEYSPENVHSFGYILRDSGYQRRRQSGGNYYAIFGKAVEDQIEYKNAVQRRRTNREKNVPFIQDGREYIISYRALGEYLKVAFNTISSWLKMGLLEGTYIKAGSRIMFDTEKVKERLKSSKVLMDDVARDQERQKRVKGEIKRGGINTAMKSLGSPERVYKSPVVKDAVKSNQTFLSQDEIDKLSEEKGS